MGAAVRLTREKGIYRVRVLPSDAAPSRPIAAETHAGYLSAQTAAAMIGKLLGLDVIDETRKGGGDGAQ